MAGLLMTRPVAASRKFVAGLPDWVLALAPVVISPLLDIRESHVGVDLAGINGVIFTSSNGVRWARRLSPDVPAYCVGAATTWAAKNAGWPAEMRGENAETLIRSLTDVPVTAPLLHIRGCHGRGDVAQSLSGAGVPCSEVVVYEQQLLPLTEEARNLLMACNDIIVPLFSPRSARQFADTCPTGANPHLIAMSSAVANQLKELKFKSLTECETPDADAMKTQIINLCKSLHRVEGDGPAQ
ncbi:uroporphyrinogen-III synthase [Aliisedimentitalea scapharcae]|uniref:Uroporphyrinogen-III synthase n=1 Tax=Aliisedimentitalea scapharcae TaxID=1524259 RepID=A0ABZ2XV36_9RHOB